ncbi:MAG: CpsD/CapB family tyrosine-protein kinase [Gammaproteobacteria bacterium]|nr:CpsD/CapB family tyrosine-protein kinase [Gammaproteobacteria bacterium]
MTKIYEALKQAYRERTVLEKADSAPLRPLKSVLKTASKGVEDQMIGLYRIICALLPDLKGRTIQFIAPSGGEGTSILLREFAKMLALKLNISVLVLDTDPQGSQLSYFGISQTMDWNEAHRNDKPIKESIYQVENTGLFISQVAMSEDSITEIIHSPWIEWVLEELKQDFDLILIDSQPATRSSKGPALSHMADGVILVVEAAKTRWQAVEQLKKNINMRGGNILGVFLSKREHYIPGFIYKLL